MKSFLFRKLLDASFTAVTLICTLFLAGALFIVLVPILLRGSGALVFRGTIEHREFLIDEFDRGNAARVEAQLAEVATARQPVFDALDAYESGLHGGRKRGLPDLSAFDMLGSGNRAGGAEGLDAIMGQLEGREPTGEPSDSTSESTNFDALMQDFEAIDPTGAAPSDDASSEPAPESPREEGDASQGEKPSAMDLLEGMGDGAPTGAPAGGSRGTSGGAEASIQDLDFSELGQFSQSADASNDSLDSIIRGMDTADAKKAETPPEPDAEMKQRQQRRASFEELKAAVTALLGPRPGTKNVILLRDRYGSPRWDETLELLHKIRYKRLYVPRDDPRVAPEVTQRTKANQMVEIFVSRQEDFEGTSLEPVFESYFTDSYVRKMMLPEWTFYWGFWTDDSRDVQHKWGGIREEILGTVYLTVGALLVAAPLGIIAAIYLAEFAGNGIIISVIRSCIGTLAGVPSIVFGLFGLAFFLSDASWFQISPNKSVAAGSCTLALMILPTIICAAEEAIRAVPLAYKEAAMGLGASRGRTVLTVILPAALPGVLTGVILSMGRAAGETAPIIFTAAVAIGSVPGLAEVFQSPTPALPWAIYNITAEHPAPEEVRHVQYGMVLTLISIVLALSLAALIIRGRISKKLRG